MRKNIYLPDELGERVRRAMKGPNRINVSAVCQRAIRRAIAARLDSTSVTETLLVPVVGVSPLIVSNPSRIEWGCRR